MRIFLLWRAMSPVTPVATPWTFQKIALMSRWRRPWGEEGEEGGEEEEAEEEVGRDPAELAEEGGREDLEEVANVEVLVLVLGGARSDDPAAAAEAA